MDLSLSVHVFNVLYNSEKYGLCGGKKFYIHCPQVEICAVHSFDVVGDKKQAADEA